MKRVALFMLIALMAFPALADKYLFVWVNVTATAADKEKVQNKYAARLGGTNIFDYADLPVWRLTSNTNKMGYVLCIDVTGRGYGVSLAEMNSWKSANISQPTKVMFSAGNSNQVLYDGGLEPTGEDKLP